MTEYVVGDEEYSEEINTSYDQEQDIGDTPSSYFAFSEPVNAKNGQTNGRLGEKLNKDGTGVKHATRGLNPNNTPHKVLKFIYVSKDGCDICKQYDGMSFDIDSPNRPVIPRLESQGKNGGRPYTHPSCKCKWTTVFSDNAIKNYKQLNQSKEVDGKTMDRTKKWYGIGFDKLSPLEQKLEVINMFKEILGMEGRIQSVESEPSKYGIQPLLDRIVEGSLNRNEKLTIEEKIESNFSMDYLLNLIAEKLANKIGKKLGVESKSIDIDSIYRWMQRKIDPDEQEDYSGYGYGIMQEASQKFGITIKQAETIWDSAGTEANESVANEELIMRHRCNICKKEFVTQDKVVDHKYDIHGILEAENIEHVQHNESYGAEGGKGSGRVGHVKYMLGAEADEECANCMIKTERDNGKCILCGT